MDESGPTAAYARPSDTPTPPLSVSRRQGHEDSSTSTGPRPSSSTTSSSSSSSTRYSKRDPPQAEATAPVPSRAWLHPRHDTRDEVRQRTDDQTSARSHLSRPISSASSNATTASASRTPRPLASAPAPDRCHLIRQVRPEQVQARTNRAAAAWTSPTFDRLPDAGINDLCAPPEKRASRWAAVPDPESLIVMPDHFLDRDTLEWLPQYGRRLY